MDLGVPLDHIPLSVKKALALHLDVGTEHTWEHLAECFGLDYLTISAIKVRSRASGWTLCLLQNYGHHVTVEQLILWLRDIGNLAAQDILIQAYESIRSKYKSYLEKLQNTGTVRVSERLESPVTNVREQQLQQNSPASPSEESTVGKTFTNTDSEPGMFEGDLHVKPGKLTVFLSCSDDGIRQCREIRRWLEKHDINAISVDDDQSASRNLLSWVESQIGQADFVVLLASDNYCRDVLARDQPSESRSILTRYVHDLMRTEYVNSGCRHYRSIPVLLKQTNHTCLPLWFNSTYLYTWPADYDKLFRVFYDCPVKY